jgi:hypothetical protein
VQKTSTSIIKAFGDQKIQVLFIIHPPKPDGFMLFFIEIVLNFQGA